MPSPRVSSNTALTLGLQRNENLPLTPLWNIMVIFPFIWTDCSTERNHFPINVINLFPETSLLGKLKDQMQLLQLQALSFCQRLLAIYHIVTSVYQKQTKEKQPTLRLMRNCVLIFILHNRNCPENSRSYLRWAWASFTYKDLLWVIFEISLNYIIWMAPSKLML